MDRLHSKLLTLIKEKGWDELTPVQKQTLSPILQGHNTLVIAPTGYGKTEAALLPIFNLMLYENIKPVSVLYITPLKALINDITLRIEWWSNKLGFLVSRKHGEVPQKEKSYRLKKAPHILVTTPEGLEIDLDWATRFREYYKNLKWIIVDEVHELVSSKRGAQLSILLERLKDFIGYDFQRIALSATVNNEELVAKLIFGSSNRNYDIIRVNSTKTLDVKISRISNDKDVWESAAKSILSKVEKPTLLFTNSRFTTERLHEELEKLKAKDIYVHHSSISKEEKLKVEESLRSGKANLVICTRTLELGIHIGDIKKVILYRPPPSVSSLLQRLGRSGHAVNSISRGEILCLYDFDVLEGLALYRLAKEGKLEKPLIFPYFDVIAREIIGLALQYDEIEMDRIYQIIKSSYYYKNLSEDKIFELVHYLAKREVIKIENNKIKLGKAFFKIWRFDKDNKISWAKEFSEFFSFINADDTFSIRFESTPVGEIDAIYVYRHLRNNDVIRIGGKIWKITSIDFNKHLINVIPSNNGEGEIPIWKGDNISKSSLLTYELPNVINEMDLDKEILDRGAHEAIKKFIDYYKIHKLPLPSRNIIYIEKENEEIIYSGIVPEKIANTISHLLLYLATRKYNLNVSSRASIYGFSIKGVEEDLMKEVLKVDSEKELRKLIVNAIVRSPLFFAIAKEIQYSFGKLGKLDPKEDKLILKEALKQTVAKYFSIKRTLNYIRKIKSGRIKMIQIEGITPLGRAVLTHTPIRPWISDLQLRIYQALKGGAYTLEELSEIIGVSKKTLEMKLKKMRRPYSKYRTVSFIDIDSNEVRWCLEEDLKEIVESGDYYNSFNPINLDETYIAVIRAHQSEGSTEIVFRVKDLVKSSDYFLKKIPYNEVLELRIKDPNDALVYSISPKYYYVGKNTIGFLVLNAISFIQGLKFG